MTHTVYSQSPTAPYSVPSGGSLPIPFTELDDGAASPTMYLRIANCDAAVSFTVTLQTGTGDPVTLMLNDNVAIYNQPGANPTNYVGAAQTTPDAANPNVWAVQVSLQMNPAPAAWKMSIANADAKARRFLFVVAGSDAETKVAWIDSDIALPTPTAALNIAAYINTSFTPANNVQVYNYGTDLLTVSGSTLSGTDAASYSVATPPATPIPTGGSATLPVTLQPVATAKSLSATLDIQSSDPNPQKALGHNSEIALTGTTTQLEIAFMLDGSGSMALDPDGQATFIGVDNASTRWGWLQSGVQACLTVLGNFAANKGTFAVGVYPNMLGFPADPTAPYGGPFPVPSPSAGDLQLMTPITAANIAEVVTPGTGLVAQHFTRVNGAATPIGAGIARAIGETSTTYGYFPGQSDLPFSSRWLVIMSDGNDNSDPPYPNDFLNNGTTGQGFVPKQIQVACIGYGNTDAPIEPCNTASLQQLIGGSYFGNPMAPNATERWHYAQADVDPTLADQLIKTLLPALGVTTNPIVDPTGTLTSASPTVTQQVQIGSYDHKVSFIVNWTTANPGRLQVQVVTPLGETLSGTGTGTGYEIDTNPRFCMITVGQDFLANTANPGKPRYGTWTLIITLESEILAIRARRAEAAVGNDSERYSYQIIADTGLSMECTTDRRLYTAGNPIQLSATLALDGVGIPVSAVNMALRAPGQSHLNWLASTPVSAAEYAAAAAATAGNPDITSIGIKQIALHGKGGTFPATINNSTAMLSPAGTPGGYVATVTSTTVPGTYEFLVTGVGALPDGTLFSRQRSIMVEVIAVADPESTIIQVSYSQGSAGVQAVVTVWPRDAYGNVVMVDPSTGQSVVFTTSIGTLTGPVVDNHNGSYSQTVTFPAGSSPIVGITVGGVQVGGGTGSTGGVTLLDPSTLHFVDRVYSYQKGGEAGAGANQHTDPNACLGDFAQKPSPGYVSLGAAGTLVVGFNDHYAKAGDNGQDLYVFVHPDAPARPYSVDAMHGDDADDWYEIGKSSGGSQAFSLRHHMRLPTACAVRIRDRSYVIRNPDGTASASPGVSILAVGAPIVERGDGDLDDMVVAWLKKLGTALL